MPNQYFFENPFEKIIQKAQAQGANIISPTLPVDVSQFQPQATIMPSPPPSQQVRASLLGEDIGRVLRINDRLRVYLAINSAGQEIQSFSVTFNYDPKFIKYATKEFLETGFETNENIVVDEAKSIIIIRGSAKSGREIINKNVGFIDFIIIDKGTTELKISNTNEDSEILDLTGKNILAAVDNFSFSIQEQLATSPTLLPTPRLSQGPTRRPGASRLPDSALDLTTLAQIFPVIIGVIVVGIGIWLKKIMSSKDDEI